MSPEQVAAGEVLISPVASNGQLRLTCAFEAPKALQTFIKREIGSYG